MDTIYQLYGTSNNLLFSEESILRYCEGGYHPVALGDTFASGRYVVHHKLGYGGFATVWLVRDTRIKKWVALKILTAEQSKRSAELEILKKLQHPNLVKLLDHFEHLGPNGRHKCLILELLGPTLNTVLPDFFASDGDCDIRWIHGITKQILDGVDFIHAAGYSHGDLSPRNLAFSCPRMATLSDVNVFMLLGETHTEAVVRTDHEELPAGLPRDMIKSTSWPGWPDADLDSELQEMDASFGAADDDDEHYHSEIVIMDLGEAFDKTAAVDILAQPGGLQVPESIFDGTVDYRADLWRTGLIIYYLLYGIMPFQWQNLVQLVASIIEFAGPLPEAWVLKWTAMAENSGNLFVREAVTNGNAGSVLRDRIEAARGDHERTVLLTLVYGLVKLEPSLRMSSQEALIALAKTGHANCAR